MDMLILSITGKGWFFPVPLFQSSLSLVGVTHVHPHVLVCSLSLSDRVFFLSFSFFLFSSLRRGPQPPHIKVFGGIFFPFQKKE